MSENLRCWMIAMVLIPLMFMLLCFAFALVGATMLKIWFPIAFSLAIYTICQITFYKILKEFRDHAAEHHRKDSVG